jgi:hypothetical protein
MKNNAKGLYMTQTPMDSTLDMRGPSHLESGQICSK